MANTARKRARTRREPMSRVDTAWLRMERGTNPMMITGVLMFAEQMSLAALRQVIKQRFLAYKRFRAVFAIGPLRQRVLRVGPPVDHGPFERVNASWRGWRSRGCAARPGRRRARAPR